MKHLDNCSAPICAHYDNLPRANWYPNEEVCGATPQQPWQTKMKRIKKLASQGKIDPNRYFTLPMLDELDIIRPSLAGIDPDQTPEEREAAEAEWVSNPDRNRSRRTRLV